MLDYTQLTTNKLLIPDHLKVTSVNLVLEDQLVNKVIRVTLEHGVILVNALNQLH